MSKTAKNVAVGMGWAPEITRAFNALVDAMDYRALSAPGLAIGSGDAAEVLVANTVVFLSAGVFKSKATAEVAFTATTHDITADAALIQEAVYLVCLNAAGTLTLHMGVVATGSGAALIPDTPAGLTCIGYVRIEVEAGSTDFDAVTDDLSASHLTDTYVDLGDGNRAYAINRGDG